MNNSYTVGADPEIFLRRHGKIIGSERVVPETKSIVARDGIQVEFNPPASMSSSILGSWIGQAFTNLDKMAKAHEGVSICFDQVVEVEQSELRGLSEKSRILGCSPSENAYGVRPIGLTDEERAIYPIRAAGGHLHFGLKGDLFDERVRLVNWLDVFVGNTCVLIDREPKAAIRRVHYGRAGEYRIPNHGLEYRTLSNFWLRNYTLLDFVLGLADIAVKVVEDSIDEGDLESRLIDVVDIQNVVKAIDTNDINLAWANFKDVSKLGLFNGFSTMKLFKWFELIEKQGLEKVFPEDPVEHWIRGKQQQFNKYLFKERSLYGSRSTS